MRKTPEPSRPSYEELKRELETRTRDLAESLRQQTATADVLKVISRSTFDLRAVFSTLVESARALCGAPQGMILMRDGEVYRTAMQVGYPPAFEQYIVENPIRPSLHSGAGRAALTREVAHFPDVLLDPDYRLTDGQRLGGYRTMLSVPLLREGEVVGVFSLGRTEPEAFTPRQIELVQTFADQAVIAIENVRLFEEVSARTRDLSEALQQQTATADVLKIISRSAFDLQTVLDTLVESAARLCEADMGNIFQREGEVYHGVSHFGFPPEWVDYAKAHPFGPGLESATGRVALERKAVQIADVLADPTYSAGEFQRLGGYRTIFGVPMLRGGDQIGVMNLARRTVRPFTERQIELVQTFADQAVIAIENVRLFDELNARTRDLTEALQQQTATAEVLKLISRSAFDLQTVLDTLTRSAARYCDADRACVFQREGGLYRCVSNFGFSPQWVAFSQTHPFGPGTHSATGRVALEGKVVHMRDVLADPDYSATEHQRLGNYRTLLGAPLLREGAPIGVFILARDTVRPFTERQIEVVQAFADQAVIAMENVRLFEQVQAKTRDLAEALAQQTATSEVLKVISRSRFGLKAIFQTLIDSAVRLCATDGSIYLREGDIFLANAAFDQDPERLKARNATPRRPGRDSIVSRVALSGSVEQIPDNLADAEFKLPANARMNNVRALLGVPLLRNGEVEGVFVLGRPEPGLFTGRQIELVKTFADQAVIAIENVRLFEQLEARTRDLSEALQQQTATADVLKVISRSAFDLQTVLNTLTASAVSLCEADQGVILRRQGELYCFASNVGFSEEFEAYANAHPFAAGPGSTVGRVALGGRTVHVPDVLAEPTYTANEFQRLGQYRTNLAVPLLREGMSIGMFVVTRRTVNPFTERQIELVESFADQAVIAIENVRLFDEVQARTDELARSLDELRGAQSRLVQTEKLASLGQLTAGIAHEIKNPLNFVNNFSSLSIDLIDELRDLLAPALLNQKARDEMDELTGMLKSNLEKVVQHGKRADSIVKNMLLHSREGSGERRPVNVNALVEESVNLAYHGARAEKPGFNATLVKELDPSAGEADLYPQEITRVLLNLISNGFYATNKRKAENGDAAFEPRVVASTRDLGETVEIRIHDNGTGIPEEVRAKMFNPFFTTKPAGEGTGLGLSLSQDIVVKQHGGTIDVATSPGAFTEFTIVLPRGRSASAPMKSTL